MPKEFSQLVNMDFVGFVPNGRTARVELHAETLCAPVDVRGLLGIVRKIDDAQILVEIRDTPLESFRDKKHKGVNLGNIIGIAWFQIDDLILQPIGEQPPLRYENPASVTYLTPPVEPI